VAGVALPDRLGALSGGKCQGLAPALARGVKFLAHFADCGGCHPALKILTVPSHHLAEGVTNLLSPLVQEHQGNRVQEGVSALECFAGSDQPGLDVLSTLPVTQLSEGLGNLRADRPSILPRIPVDNEMAKRVGEIFQMNR